MATSTSEAFTVQADSFRRELLAHCYRMLGSVHDAEDRLQETLLRAWRAYDRYDPSRAALRTWRYRIATNACLTALEQRSRRPLPSGLGAPPSDDPEQPLSRGEEMPWLQPIPDAMLGDPADILSSRSSLRLAFVAALQFLPARQRAVLILREVLDWPAADVAAALDMTTTAVNSAPQRARARLREARLSEDQIDEPADPRHRSQIERHAVAFENADLAALGKLLTDDAVLEMPPFRNWYAGREPYIRFIARVFTRRGTYWRMVPAYANGQPALAAYARAQDGGYALNTLQVFTVTESGISVHLERQATGRSAFGPGSVVGRDVGSSEPDHEGGERSAWVVGMAASAWRFPSCCRSSAASHTACTCWRPAAARRLPRRPYGDLPTRQVVSDDWPYLPKLARNDLVGSGVGLFRRQP